MKTNKMAKKKLNVGICVKCLNYRDGHCEKLDDNILDKTINCTAFEALKPQEKLVYNKKAHKLLNKIIDLDNNQPPFDDKNVVVKPQEKEGLEEKPFEMWEQWEKDLGLLLESLGVYTAFNFVKGKRLRDFIRQLLAEAKKEGYDRGYANKAIRDEIVFYKCDDWRNHRQWAEKEIRQLLAEAKIEGWNECMKSAPMTDCLKEIEDAKKEEADKFQKILNSGKTMYEMGRKEGYLEKAAEEGLKYVSVPLSYYVEAAERVGRQEERAKTIKEVEEWMLKNRFIYFGVLIVEYKKLLQKLSEMKK